MAKVLVVEDDPGLTQTLKELLESQSHVVDAAVSGDAAMDYLSGYAYDLVILDWELPGQSGIEVCRQFRARGGSTPVLMLTGKTSIEEKEAGLDAGADDYLTKPFHPRELKARMRALLRRPAAMLPESLSIGNISLDTGQHSVMRDGEVTALQPVEFALLEFFMRHPGQVFSLDDLTARVWGSEADVTMHAVYAAIKRLRKKIDTPGKPSLIKSVHGVGYVLERA